MDVFDEPDRLYIVLEFMEGGMLFDVLKREKRFSEKVCGGTVKKKNAFALSREGKGR